MTGADLDARLAAALDLAFDVAETVLDTAPPAEVEALLRSALYRDWYCAVGEKRCADRRDRDLAELLRAAHAGSRRWEEGWEVTRLSARGKVAVARRGENRVVHVIDCLPAAGAALRPGERLSVVERRCSESLNPGDWVTFSEGWHGLGKPLLRLYWNALPDGAPRIVDALTRAWAGGAVDYFIKCPRRPAEYDRRDAVVLYLPRDGFDAAAPAIAAAAETASPWLCDPVPPLTAALARGLGLAEDPAEEGQSFGTSRCRLIARALVAAGPRRSNWAAAVAAAFDAAGIPRARPWAARPDSREYSLP